MSFKDIKWSIGQAVKTPPSQGGIMGSIPVGVTRTVKPRNTYLKAFLGFLCLRINSVIMQ